MRTLQSAGRCALAAAIVCGWLIPALSPEIRGGEPSALDAGEKLFSRTFVPHNPGSAGDGLGPVFNAASCVACHRQGGVGGGGGRDHDVLLLTLEAGNPLGLARVLEAAGGSKTMLLHAHGTSPGYDKWRRDLLNPPLPGFITSSQREQVLAKREQQAELTNRLVPHEKTALRLTRRNTPPLFGLGLIDEIPDDEIQAEAARQARQSPDTAGRVASANPELADPLVSAPKLFVRVGKFGWRGQIATLQEFVLAACANELGLETPNHKQPLDPLDVARRSGELDISADECRNLTFFVASLPRPQADVPNDRLRAGKIREGEGLFTTVGCAACHVRRLGQVDELYSDLLLHNMGSELADPVAANPPVRIGTVVDPSAPSNYYGGSIQFAGWRTRLEKEWKTPPLWGVRDSAPYLHDGRAATLAAAIEQHGGQGSASREAFARLVPENQKRVLAFLNSLAAPPEAVAVVE